VVSIEVWRRLRREADEMIRQLRGRPDVTGTTTSPAAETNGAGTGIRGPDRGISRIDE